MRVSEIHCSKGGIGINTLRLEILTCPDVCKISFVTRHQCVSNREARHWAATCTRLVTAGYLAGYPADRMAVCLCLYLRISLATRSTGCRLPRAVAPQPTQAGFTYCAIQHPNQQVAHAGVVGTLYWMACTATPRRRRCASRPLMIPGQHGYGFIIIVQLDGGSTGAGTSNRGFGGLLPHLL